MARVMACCGEGVRQRLPTPLLPFHLSSSPFFFPPFPSLTFDPLSPSSPPFSSHPPFSYISLPFPLSFSFPVPFCCPLLLTLPFPSIPSLLLFPSFPQFSLRPSLPILYCPCLFLPPPSLSNLPIRPILTIILRFNTATHSLTHIGLTLHCSFYTLFEGSSFFFLQ